MKNRCDHLYLLWHFQAGGFIVTLLLILCVLFLRPVLSAKFSGPHVTQMSPAFVKGSRTWVWHIKKTWITNCWGITSRIQAQPHKLSIIDVLKRPLACSFNWLDQFIMSSVYIVFMLDESSDGTKSRTLLPKRTGEMLHVPNYKRWALMQTFPFHLQAAVTLVFYLQTGRPC